MGLGPRAGRLPKLGGVTTAPEPLPLTWLPLGRWLRVLCSPRSCQDTRDGGRAVLERSPCPGVPLQPGPCGWGDREEAWRRPGTRPYARDCLALISQVGVPCEDASSHSSPGPWPQ